MSVHDLIDNCNEMANEIISAVLNIAYYNFEWNLLTYVLTNTTFICNMNLFLRSYNKSVIVGNGVMNPQIDDIQQVVIFSDDIINIMDSLDAVSYQFDANGKYIIVCQSPFSWKCDSKEAVKMLWLRRITNVVFLRGDMYVTAYTYFPLSDEKCEEGDPKQIVSLKACTLNVTKCGFFVKKLGNLNKCKLIASTFIQKPFMYINNGIPAGADGDLLVLIAEFLNATLEVVTPTIGSGRGKLEPNGTWSGSLADIYYGIANISMTSAVLTVPRISYFQISKSYRSISIVWVSHPAISLSPSLKLLHPFKASTQIALGISLLLVMLCALLLSCKKIRLFLCRKIKLRKLKLTLLFNSWMICTGVTMSRLSSKSAFYPLIIIWIWYCFLIRTFYQVWLINSLQGKFYLENFHKLDEAIEDGYSFGGGITLKEYYSDNQYVYNNWKLLDSRNTTAKLYDISRGLNFIQAIVHDTANYILNGEKIHVHVLPEKIAVSPTVLFFRNDSPLVAPINDILQKLTESGFVDRFYMKYTTANVAKHLTQIREPINIEHYTGCYVVLLSGWVISILTLVAENCFLKILQIKMYSTGNKDPGQIN